MKKFILWLARVFKVNVVDGNFIEKRGNDVIIKGELRVSGGVHCYCDDTENKEE